MPKATAAPTARNISWNKGDDIKLLGLLREGRVDPNIEASKDNIDQIREVHFDHIPYRNFRVLWLRKTAEYITDGTLKGMNKASAAAATDDDEADADDTMPPKKAAKKSAPPAASVESLEGKMNQLTVKEHKPFSFEQRLPNVAKKYCKNEKDWVEVEYIGMPYDQDFYRVALSDDGMDASLSVATLAEFGEHKRIKYQMGDAYKKNDPRAIAHSNLVQKVRKVVKPKNGMIWDGESPQVTRLPVKCKGPPVKKWNYLPLGTTVTAGGVSHKQFALVLSIFFRVADERIKREKKGSTTIIASMSADSDDSDIDENDDDYEDGDGDDDMDGK